MEPRGKRGQYQAGLRSGSVLVTETLPKVEKAMAGTAIWPIGLFASPLRRALIEKRIQSFAKIPAHVAHQDQILAFLARQPPLQADQRLFGGVERERCIAGDQDGKLIGPPLQ